MTSDWVYLGSLLALPGLLLHACQAVNTAAPVASSDRHSVAVALSSSLWDCCDPLPALRLGGPYVLVGALT